MIKDYFVHIPPHLSDVLADLSGLSTDAEFSELIEAGRPLLFDFDYPVPKQDKEYLENYILNNYITRRIGSGNTKKWRQYLKAKMLEIMPYYSDLLKSTHLEYDPLINHDITTTDDGSGTLDSTTDKRTDNDDSYNKSGNETAHNTNLNRFSDTPQGDSSRVWETDAQGHARLSDYYITDVRGITDDATRNWSENGSDQRDIVEHGTVDQDTTHENTNYKLGVSGSSKSKLVNEWRETFLRIYSDITAELDPLFYNLVEVDDLIDFV